MFSRNAQTAQPTFLRFTAYVPAAASADSPRSPLSNRLEAILYSSYSFQRLKSWM